MTNYIDDNNKAKASTIYLNHLRQLCELEDTIALAGDIEGSVLATVADNARNEIIDGIGVIGNLAGIPGDVIVERYINCKPEKQIAAEMFYCESSIRSFVRSGKVKLFDYLPEGYQKEAIA